ncbi:MAG: hypothetical protein KDM63_20575, partial [Verrucomicrobiae bacterium]|nr:hypothetical protein [Verrucomicrobiae bacterium]
MLSSDPLKIESAIDDRTAKKATIPLEEIARLSQDARFRRKNSRRKQKNDDPAGSNGRDRLAVAMTLPAFPMKTTAKRRTKTGVAGARLGAVLLALSAVTAIGVTDSIAQNKRDLELGSLPPAPDLRQDSEKTFKERMKARRSAIQQQEAEKRL